MKCNEQQMSATSFSSIVTIIAFLFLVLSGRVEAAPQNTDRDRLKALWKCTLKQPDLKYAVKKLIDGNVMPRDLIENIFDAFDEPGIRIPILPNLSIMGAYGNPGFYKNDQNLLPEAEKGSETYEFNKQIATLQTKCTFNQVERYQHAFILLHYYHELVAAYTLYKHRWVLVQTFSRPPNFHSFDDELFEISADPDQPTNAEREMATAALRMDRARLTSATAEYRKCRNRLESLIGAAMMTKLDEDLLEGTSSKKESGGENTNVPTPASPVTSR